MSEAMEVWPELRQQVVELIASYPDTEAAVVARALYRLYFDKKPTANTAEKRFLLGKAFRFPINAELSPAEDQAILEEEAAKFYKQAKKAGGSSHKG